MAVVDGQRVYLLQASEVKSDAQLVLQASARELAIVQQQQQQSLLDQLLRVFDEAQLGAQFLACNSRVNLLFFQRCCF